MTLHFTNTYISYPGDLLSAVPLIQQTRRDRWGGGNEDVAPQIMTVHPYFPNSGAQIKLTFSSFFLQVVY